MTLVLHVSCLAVGPSTAAIYSSTTNSTARPTEAVPFGRVEMQFHVFNLLEVTRHVRGENDVDDHTAEFSETRINRRRSIALTHCHD